MRVRQGLKVVAVDIWFLTSVFFSIMPIILKFGTTLLFNQVNGQRQWKGYWNNLVLFFNSLKYEVPFDSLNKFSGEKICGIFYSFEFLGGKIIYETIGQAKGSLSGEHSLTQKIKDRPKQIPPIFILKKGAEWIAFLLCIDFLLLSFFTVCTILFMNPIS